VKLDKLRRTKLKHLLINRIDLVDSGDNPEANIVLFKREHEPETTQQILDNQERMDKIQSVLWAFQDSLFQIQQSDTDNKDELVKQSVKEFATAINSVDFSKLQAIAAKFKSKRRMKMTDCFKNIIWEN